MPNKLLLVAVAILISLTTMAVSTSPAEAFDSNRFIDMWNANMGVMEKAYDIFDSGRVTYRKLERMAREEARCENRVVNWLRTHRASACQRPYVERLLYTGVSARKLYKAAARAYHDKNVLLGDRLYDRAWRFWKTSDRVSDRMLQNCW